MSALLAIGCIGTLILSPLMFSTGINYTTSRFYRIYVVFAGVLVNMLIAFHMTISAFTFLYMIYSTRGFTIQEFLKDWLLKQDGFRYCILLGVNGFSIYCYFYSALRQQNDLTVQMY
jgi:hypothetical protein